MGKGKKVVIDSNVFISAFGWGGTPLRVIELLEKQEIRNCISEQTFQELCVAITYHKLDFHKKLQSTVLEFVLAYSDIYEPREYLNIVPDPEDNKFIECALVSNAKFLITGDKSLLAVKQFKNIEIVTPEEFLREQYK